MNILVNGAATDVPDGASVRALIEQLDLGARRVAVELNGDLVPRSAHAEQPLQDGDRVEIVQAIGGG